MSTADTTTIALALGMLRALARQARGDAVLTQVGKDTILTLLRDQLPIAGDALQALARVESALEPYAGKIAAGQRFLVKGGHIVRVMRTGPGVHVQFPDGCTYGFPGESFRPLIDAVIPS